jgi:hypothetical protein
MAAEGWRLACWRRLLQWHGTNKGEWLSVSRNTLTLPHVLRCAWYRAARLSVFATPWTSSRRVTASGCTPLVATTARDSAPAGTFSNVDVIAATLHRH